MRVLQVNAFHYLRGGVERTCFDEARWLAAAGHEVLHFAVRHPRNEFSPTATHFAPEVDYSEGAPPGRLLRQLPHAVWSAPAARAIAGLVRERRPDIAHVHAPSRYLTPSVLRALERAGVPIVMTLHDFKPWCTNRTLFAHGAPCERCRGGAHWHAFATGCVQGSRLRSAVGAVEAYAHDLLGAYRGVRRWIAPSRFVAAKAVEHGAPPDRVRVLPHGVERGAPAGAPAPVPPGPFVLFAGRLSPEKGVRLLPALADALAPVPVVVAGEGPLRGWLEREAASRPGLRPIGHLDDAALAAHHAGAGAIVVPSLFYETFCYAAAEALLDRRPVVASRIGAIPELVEDGVTGLLAPPGDVAVLAAGLRRALDDPAAARWAAAGRERVATLGDPGRHVAGLVALYREAAGAG